MATWISRSQRQKQNIVLKRLLLAILIFIAVFLSGLKFYPELISINDISDIISKKGRIIDSDDIDLIYSQIVADLGFGQAEIKPEPLNYKGEKKDYPCFSFVWPRGLPYVWFVSRLKSKCSSFDNLEIDAVEIKKGSSLVSWLVVPSDNRKRHWILSGLTYLLVSHYIPTRRQAASFKKRLNRVKVSVY